MPSDDRALWALRTWLDSWPGVGDVAVGMHRQGFDLQLTQYDDHISCGCALPLALLMLVSHLPARARPTPIDMSAKWSPCCCIAMRAGRRAAYLLLLTLVVLFAPLTYTDLPDQTWLGGLWNGGDNDDVILQLESTGGAVASFALCWADPVLIVLGVTAPPPKTTVRAVTVSANPTRSPPAP